jgi:hypothetical protein
VQDKNFDDSMPQDLLSHYKPLAIRAVIAACSIKAEKSQSTEPSVLLNGATEFHDVPDFWDEPAIAFIR